ncbi:MAG: GNAT family N-acetyltransferase [Chloroflexota bacterium]|nr:GNAT family N-acetyltransferase [Chloroflexota bacterium]
MEIHVRRIRPDDGPLLRGLRLRSLSDAPRAFGQSREDAVARPDAEWSAEARAATDGDRRAWFIAQARRSDAEPAEPVGLVLARRRPPDVALVFSMWVDPRVRRGGVGRELIATVEAWAASWGAQRIVLWVVADNEPAVRFYQRLGFTVAESGTDADSGRAYGALALSRPIGASVLTPAEGPDPP